MIELRITDPLGLSAAEKMAVLAFLQIAGTERDPARLASDQTQQRDEVRRVINTETKPMPPAGATIIPLPGTGIDPQNPRGEIRIDPIADLSSAPATPPVPIGNDAPDVGKVPVPPVPAVPGAPIAAAGARLAGEADGPIDTANIFGGAQQAPSVPIPPVPQAPTPPAAAQAAPSPASAPLPPAAPPAAPGPSAGAETPAAPPAPTNAVDTTGLPWDERIHAGARTKNGDGTWRKKRGVEDSVVAAVENELRGLIALPKPPAPPPGVSPMAYGDFVTKVSEWIALANPPKITQAQLQEVLAENSLQAMPQLNMRPDLIPVVYARLKAMAGE